MTNLTEQWKKGELLDGMYYMENTSGIIGMVGHSKVFPCYNVKQILAPVPSYKEYQQLRKFLEEFNALDVVKENQQLKELLISSKDIIEWYKADCGYKDSPTEAILTKIDNAIGEKK